MAFDPVALGDELIVAGEQQKSAGTSLKEAAGDVRDFGNLLANNGPIATPLLSIRDGLKSVSDLLSPVVTALQFTVNAFNGFSVPTITPQFTTINLGIGELKVVTGITLGNIHPLTGVATRVDTIRTNISTIRETLLILRDSAKALRDELPTVKASLSSAADGMEIGAGALWTSGKAFQAAGKKLGGT